MQKNLLSLIIMNQRKKDRWKEYLKKKADRKRNELKRVAKDYAKGLILKSTPEEEVLHDLLNDNGIIHEFQKPFNNDSRIYIVDFYLETFTGKYVLEIDGYWHKKTRAKDRKRTEWLMKKKGIRKVLRFWNSELDNPYLVLQQIKLLKPKYYPIPEFFL